MSDSGSELDDFQKVDLLICELRRLADAIVKARIDKVDERLPKIYYGWRAKYVKLREEILQKIDAIPSRPGIPDSYYIAKGWEIPK